jgi:hypothetical protein
MGVGGKKNRAFHRPAGNGHSGLVNPKGWQKVAGGRWGSWGRRPPDSGAGVDLHPGWGARLISESTVMGAGVERFKSTSGTPLGCAVPIHVFRWSFPRCPVRPPATVWQPSGLARGQSGECPRLFRFGRHTVPNGLPRQVASNSLAGRPVGG